MALSKSAAGVKLHERFFGVAKAESLADILDDLDETCVMSAKVDLSGAAAFLPVFYASKPYTIVEARLAYTEASSADAGINVTVGKLIVGTDDVDYFVEASATEVSKEAGFTKVLALSKSGVAAGDIITFSSAGGKSGAGEVVLCLKLKGA